MVHGRAENSSARAGLAHVVPPCDHGRLEAPMCVHQHALLIRLASWTIDQYPSQQGVAVSS